MGYGKKTKLICIEGSDGCGKETQSALLLQRLNNDGFKVKTISFPMYANDSSIFVRNYLCGKYGNVMDVGCYQASMFFIMDRLVSYMTDWKKDYESNEYDYIILDRYQPSNCIHQGCKISSQFELEKFLSWERDTEYDLLGLPKPDIVFFLNMPRWASKYLTKDRPNKINGSDKQDIHESNEEYMELVQLRASYICNHENYVVINCTGIDDSESDSMPKLVIDSPETINNKIYDIVRGYRYGN